MLCYSLKADNSESILTPAGNSAISPKATHFTKPDGSIQEKNEFSLVSVKAVLDWEESFETHVFTVQWPLIHSSKDQGKFDISAHRQYFDSTFHYQDQYIKILLKMSFINSVVRLLHNVYIDSLFQPCGKSLSRCYQRGSQVNDSIEAGIMLEECQDLFSFSLSQCVCCQG